MQRLVTEFGLEEIEAIIADKKFIEARVKGKIEPYTSIVEEYARFVLSKIVLKKKLKELADLGYNTIIWEVENNIRWDTCPECVSLMPSPRPSLRTSWPIAGVLDSSPFRCSRHSGIASTSSRTSVTGRSRKSRHAMTIFRRKVGAAIERNLIGSKKNGHRPSSPSREHLDRLHVDRIEVGPLLSIHFDVDEEFVHIVQIFL
jgi:hypothetical protein